MSRKPRIDWEAYREQLETLRYTEKKSLTEINRILQEKFGTSVTNARLSQVFSGWKTTEILKDVAEEAADSLERLANS